MTAVPDAADVLTTGAGIHLERFSTGSGDPVTLFVHGLSGDIPGTRPLGSGVRGRRVFYHQRGHGGSDAPPGPWTLDDLAADLRAVADLSAATRIVAVSLGAAALLRLLRTSPDRFDRIVVYLPASLDRPSPATAATRLGLLLDALHGADPDALDERIRAGVPAPVRETPAADAYVRRRADALRGHRLAEQLRTLDPGPPVPDPGVLGAVTAPVLVLGCHGDPVHPADVAQRLAAALPRADLHLYEDPYVLWNQRDDLRQRITGFLNVDG